MKKTKTEIYFIGKTTRLSVVLYEPEKEWSEEGAVEERIVVEKLAGENVFEESQWTVVDNPHPQLKEVAFALYERDLEIKRLRKHKFEDRYEFICMAKDDPGHK